MKLFNKLFKSLNKSLLAAVRKGDIDTARELIEKGANVDYKDNDGKSVLEYSLNNIEMLKLLLENGADPNIIIIRHYLIPGQELIFDIVNRNETDQNVEILKLLLEYGADPNVKHERGNTPLFNALSKPRMFNLLLENGADPNVNNKGGYTVLYIAVMYAKENIIDDLINHGADLNIKTRSGTTALMSAIEKNNIEITKKLLNAGANINYNILNLAKSPEMKELLSSIKFERGFKATKKYIGDNIEPKKLNILREALCKDLRSKHNLQELQGMAAALDINYKGKDKATLCAELAVDYVVKAQTGTQLPYVRARFPSSIDDRTITMSVKDLRTLSASDLRLLKKWYATNDIRDLAHKILTNFEL